MQRSITTVRPASCARRAAAGSITPSCNHNAGSFDYGFEASSCDVFVLDARSHRHRAAAAGAARICSARQMAALKAWLNDGSVRLKVLACGSVVVPGLLQHRRDAELRCPAEDADNWQRVPGQRAEILRLLGLSTAPAVALVSGDYHCACVSTIRFMRGHELVRQACAVVAPPLYAPYPAIKGFRVGFDLTPREADVIELRLRVLAHDKPVSETWLYRWTAP